MVYSVNYTLFQNADIKRIDIIAKNKRDAWIKASYEVIPQIEGTHPYSAWVASATCNNGNYRIFNTFEGKPY